MGETPQNAEDQSQKEIAGPQEATPYVMSFSQKLKDAILRRYQKPDVTLAHQKVAELIRELESRSLKVHGSSEAGSSAVKVFLKVDGWVERDPNPIIVYLDGSMYMKPHQGSLVQAAIDEPVYAAIQAVTIASRTESQTSEI